MGATSPRLVVVGGGIIGLSIGWRAARTGLEVVVVDAGPAPSGASHVAAGMLAPVTEATFGEEALLELNLESARRWPEFAAELRAASGIDLLAGSPGTLHAAVDRDQAEALQRIFAYQQELGLDVRWLTGRDLQSAEPALHPAVRWGVRAPGDLSVDPREALRALAIAMEAEGGELRTGTVDEVWGSGVLLADGATVEGTHVVIAGGCWSGSIEGVPTGLSKVLRPVKGQILRLRLRPPAPALNHTIRTEEVYLVPRLSGEVVVGATVEEMGFDSTTTAGAVFELLRSASEVVPGVREMELAEVSAGLRPGTPDNAPIVGPTSIPGLLVATGHFRNGVLLAPVTADAVVSIVAKQEIPEEISACSPARFGI